ncbi:MAG: hypothetical protein AAF721_18115 [Myxococcota bacterium]
MADDQTRSSWTTVAAVYAALVGYLVLRDLGATAYDDSYFFKRFAINALEHGVFAWNVADGPVHGSTSQLYQWVATLVTAVTHTHFVVAMRGLNAALLLAMGAVLARWCARACADPRTGAALALLASASPLVLTAIVTGMETALALLLVAITLTTCISPRPEASAVDPRLAAALCTLVYLTRPDATAIVVIAITVDHLRRRRSPVVFVVYLGAALTVTLLALWQYYGTALPLSFYMKSMALHSYDDETLRIGLSVKLAHFGALLTFCGVFGWLAARKEALRSRTPTLALLTAAALFCSYHLVSTNEIMGYRARFYVPAAVPLVMAAATAWRPGLITRRAGIIFVVTWAVLVTVGYGAGWLPTHHGFFLARIPWPAYAGFGLATGALLLSSDRTQVLVATAGLAGGLLGWKPPQTPVLRSDREVMLQHSREVTTARGVFDVARCLPPKSTVYHSEMGVTGLALLRMRTVDLAGIVSREPGIDRVPFQTYCSRDQPEAIFLPHRVYRALNDEVRQAPCMANYVQIVEQSSSPLHVRADLAPDFLGCATEVHMWRGP